MPARPSAALLADYGAPLHAARGELPVDLDEGRVQCHLCGRWYRALGSNHLLHSHGMTADEYRELVGLRPRHPLWAPDLSRAHGDRLRERIANEQPLRTAMAKGRALAQRGAATRSTRPARRTAGEPRARTPARCGGVPAR
jgi:ROS/MUCR transcriptional regulator protein